MWRMTHDTRHVTHDTWHVTHDTWHVTCDTWHILGGGRWTFSNNFCSLGLLVWAWRCFEEISQRISYRFNQSINDKGVCRTAPATQGLLKKLKSSIKSEAKFENLGHEWDHFTVKALWPIWIKWNLTKRKSQSVEIGYDWSKQTQCSRGCSTNTFVINWFSQSFIICGNIFTRALLPLS